MSSVSPDINDPRSIGKEHLPKARVIPFKRFNNNYTGAGCYVVGRGPTDFDYGELERIDEPVFFINDAVCLAPRVRSEKFFFAHDAEMRVWLDGSTNATAVLPIEGNVLAEAPDRVLGHCGSVVYYHRQQRADANLLRVSRDELSRHEELFVHSGTIHSLLHFVWFCGFHRVNCIGCDGTNPTPTTIRSLDDDHGYDRRLVNRSLTISGAQYSHIRKAQDLIAAIFEMELVYKGTPAP